MDERLSPEALRRRALERLEGSPEILDQLTSDDIREVLNDLEVHQAELEIQNEELRRIEAQLGTARDRYRDLYQHAPVGYLTLDIHRTILEANLTTTALLGLEPPQLLGRRFETLVAEEHRDACYLHLLEVVSTAEPRSCDLKMARGDGTVVWAHLETAPADRRRTAEEERLHVVLADVSELKRAEKQLRERERDLAETNRRLEERVSERTTELERRTAQLRRLAAELTRAEQAERRRLAALLHDNLQQLLVAARMQLEAGVRSGDPMDLVQDAPRVVELINEAVDVARHLTRRLRPPVLYESGLLPALEWLVGEMSRRHGLEVRLEASEGAEARDVEIAALLFECASELLFNVVKHAGTDQATIELRLPPDRPEALLLRVSDRGRGFDRSILDGDEPSGYGLLHMSERISFIGGEMRLESALGEGVRVELEAPRASTIPKRATTTGAEEPAPPPVRADRPRVLVVDDHAVVRRGIASMIESAGLEIVAQAADGVEALRLVEQHRPEVVVMDVNLPGMNGIEATREIHRRWPWIGVVGLSVQDDTATAHALAEAGARSFLSKACDLEELIAAIRSAAVRPLP